MYPKDILNRNVRGDSQAVPVAEVHRERARLIQMVDSLNEVSESLCNKLSDVVRPETANLEENKKPESPMTNLGNELSTLSSRIEFIRNRLGSVIDRLEL